MNGMGKMLYFPNTLPSFAKMLIGFHTIYRHMWQNIYPSSTEIREEPKSINNDEARKPNMIESDHEQCQGNSH